MSDKQRSQVAAWNAANRERKRELTRRGNRTLRRRQKALSDICRSLGVAQATDQEGDS